MEYFKCFWVQPEFSEPVLYVVEIDENRLEKRRVDVFQDGSLGLVGNGREINSFAEGATIPALEEIAQQWQMFPFAIDEAEFEQVWDEAWRRLVIEAEDAPMSLARSSN